MQERHRLNVLGRCAAPADPLHRKAFRILQKENLRGAGGQIDRARQADALAIGGRRDPVGHCRECAGRHGRCTAEHPLHRGEPRGGAAHQGGPILQFGVDAGGRLGSVEGDGAGFQRVEQRVRIAFGAMIDRNRATRRQALGQGMAAGDRPREAVRPDRQGIRGGAAPGRQQALPEQPTPFEPREDAQRRSAMRGQMAGRRVPLRKRSAGEGSRRGFTLQGRADAVADQHHGPVHRVAGPRRAGTGDQTGRQRQCERTD